MNLRVAYFLGSLCFLTSLLGQQNVPGIYGWIEDKETGERIENALVIDSSDLQYTYSNRDGYYNMGVGSGRHGGRAVERHTGHPDEPPPLDIDLRPRITR